jgi:hypothetical protein
MCALAIVAAEISILMHGTEHLEWLLFAVLLPHSLASNLAVLQAMPAISRRLPRTRATAVVSWIALACVLAGCGKTADDDHSACL